MRNCQREKPFLPGVQREDSKLRADIKNPELLQENLIYVTRTILKEEPLFISSERTARIAPTIQNAGTMIVFDTLRRYLIFIRRY